MSIRQVITLVIAALAIVLASVAAFLPGPYNHVSIGLSALAQMTGFFGFLLVPVGAIWLYIELRNRKNADIRLNRWTNGFYLALMITIPGFAFLLLLLAVAFHEIGWIGNIISITFIVVLAIGAWRGIGRLKNKTTYSFNPAPLYVVLIPIVSICAKRLLIDKIFAENSREIAITRSMPIINALEEYNVDNGYYPETLAALEGKYIEKIPRSNIMGIKPYQYEKRGDSYQIFFVQWLHWGATKEVVVYDKSERARRKGYFAEFRTGYEGWRYYWFD